MEGSSVKSRNAVTFRQYCLFNAKNKTKELVLSALLLEQQYIGFKDKYHTTAAN